MHLTKRLRTYALTPEKYLVVNALNGEISVVGGTVHAQMEALRQGRPHECSEEVLRALQDRKLAFPSREDEDDAFRALVDHALDDYLERARTEYCFAVNTHCNFNCVYCFEPEVVRAPTATLSEEQLDAAFGVVDASLAARPEQRAPEFTLYGGEPLLVPSKPIVLSIIRRVAARSFKANIITNGYMLKSFLDVLDAHHECIDSIQITLDGPGVEHDRRRVLRSGAGTFERIAANIDAFLDRDYRTWCSIRTSFDRKNVQSIAALKQLMDERGWSGHPRVRVFPVTIQDHRAGCSMDGLIGYNDLLDAVLPFSTDSGGGPFDLGSIHVLGHVRNFLGMAAKGKRPSAFIPRATFCGGAALRLFVFHSDGRIYPCYEVCGQGGLAIGTYYPRYQLDDDMAAQWSGSRILRQKECFECSISTFCGGGCASGAVSKIGKIQTAFCEGAIDVFDRYFNIIAEDYHRCAGATSIAEVTVT